jgi:hypothetical protein
MPMYHEYNDCWQQHYQQMAVIARTKPKSRTAEPTMPFNIMSTAVVMSIALATLIIAVVL